MYVTTNPCDVGQDPETLFRLLVYTVGITSHLSRVGVGMRGGSMCQSPRRPADTQHPLKNTTHSCFPGRMAISPVRQDALQRLGNCGVWWWGGFPSVHPSPVLWGSLESGGRMGPVSWVLDFEGQRRCSLPPDSELCGSEGWSFCTHLGSRAEDKSTQAGARNRGSAEKCTPAWPQPPRSPRCLCTWQFWEPLTALCFLSQFGVVSTWLGQKLQCPVTQSLI